MASIAPASVVGTYTALVTPFRDDLDKTIDWSAFEALVESQIAGGVTGLVPCGTTGESPALTHEEHNEVVRRTVTLARGRVQVFAGTGASSTTQAVAFSRKAEEAGADGVMVVVPYYNKPTQSGLLQHFSTVAASVGVPVIAYNIPARTGTDMITDTVAALCERARNLIAVKEATGNVLRCQELKRRMGDRLVVLSGDDALTLPMVAVGAAGVISVTSNLLPAAVSRATRLALDGRMAEARKAHMALLPVHEAMFVESNPAPVKVALAMRGPVKEVVRGPLTQVTDRSRDAVRSALMAFEAQEARAT